MPDQLDIHSCKQLFIHTHMYIHANMAHSFSMWLCLWRGQSCNLIAQQWVLSIPREFFLWSVARMLREAGHVTSSQTIPRFMLMSCDKRGAGRQQKIKRTNKNKENQQPQPTEENIKQKTKKTHPYFQKSSSLSLFFRYENHPFDLWWRWVPTYNRKHTHT